MRAPRIVRAALLLVVAGSCGPVEIDRASTERAATAASLDDEEKAFLRLLNDHRAQSGLPSLAVSVALTDAAEWMSGDMAAKNYFSHTDSLDRDPFVRMSAFGYGHNTWKAENIAAGNADAAATFAQWKNSAGHNQNMLNANFHVIGVARVFNGSSTYRWYWTTDFGGFVDATLDPPEPVTTVNAASYAAAIGAAPEAIVAGFGRWLAQTTLSATTLPLPTQLGDTVVSVNGVAAPLFFVSPGQVNYQVPPGTALGSATVRVLRAGAPIAGGSLAVSAVAPGLFTARADGKGTPAGSAYRNGTYERIANDDGSPRAIDVGSDAAPTFLILYGTGIRGRSALGAVRAIVGGREAPVAFAGAQGGFVGLDQVNVELPRVLAGAGLVEVVLTADGREANRVQILIR